MNSLHIAVKRAGSMQLTDSFAIADSVVSREVGGEMVLLDLASGQYFGLDPVGSRIWELLSEGTRSLGSICDAVEAEYEAERQQIETDVIALADHLLEMNLIVGTAS